MLWIQEQPCRDEAFLRIFISIKAYNVNIFSKAFQLMLQKVCFPE